MSFKLGLAQSGFPQDGNVLAQVRSFAEQAQNQSVDLLAFPENLMHPCELTQEQISQLAEPLSGPFVSGLCNIASKFGMWLVATCNERNPDSSKPYNTCVIIDEKGDVRGSYRKCHLYDAHGARETDRLSAGAQPNVPFETPFGSIGLQVCYDLRFPESARTLALGGCDLICYPAAWHEGDAKELHWQSLLRARAIENECFVAGICHSGEKFVSTSYAFDPMGNTLISGTEDLLTCTIDLDVLAATRQAMPIFKHRRPELYQALSN